VAVAFTPTETEHLPAREHREEELRVLKRQGCGGGAADSADVADRTPAFLKDKGDALYWQGNYGWARGPGAKATR
jgi:dyslexia susceptibility 1 candidate gene 1 protein